VPARSGATRPSEELLFNAFQRDGITLYIAGDGDLLAGHRHDLRLIVDFVDLAILG